MDLTKEAKLVNCLQLTSKMEKSYNKSSDKISWRFLQDSTLMMISQVNIHFTLSGKKW